MTTYLKTVGSHLRGDRSSEMPATHMLVDGTRSPSANGALGEHALPQHQEVYR